MFFFFSKIFAGDTITHVRIEVVSGLEERDISIGIVIIREMGDKTLSNRGTVES